MKSISNELRSVRADDLSLMIAIVGLFDANGEVLLSELYRVLMRQWKRARAYHYIADLMKVGLAKKDGYRLSLTSIGHQLRTCEGDALIDTKPLQDFQKVLLRKSLLGCNAFCDFMTMFLVKKVPFTSYRQLIDNGSYVALSRRLDGKSNLSLRSWVIRTANGTTENLDPSAHKAIYWTLKNWGKSLDLIDELHPEASKVYSDRVSHILYPIKRPSLDIDCFVDYLEQLATKQNFVGRRLAIPELMYKFCIAYFLPRKQFLHQLVHAYLAYPGRLRLEKTSRALIDEAPHATRRNQDGGEEYSNYPKIGNTFYGSVVIHNAHKPPSRGEKHD